MNHRTDTGQDWRIAIIDTNRSAPLDDAGLHGHEACTVIRADGTTELVIVCRPLTGTNTRYTPASGVEHEQLGTLPTRWAARTALAPLRCGHRSLPDCNSAAGWPQPGLPHPGAGGRMADANPATEAVDHLAALRRRRGASRRLPVLDCGRTDPWYYDEPQLTDHQIDGWAAAAEILAAGGLRPIVPVRIARALWRRGDRDLAVTLAVRE